ncbi:MAG: DNA-binding protein [Syntrophaceae bacterium]|nr:DNA-binding protein [Syntrophaceae bacterium]
MKKTYVVLLAAVLVVGLTAATASSAPWKGYRGSGGWGTGTPYNQMYNPANVETLSGEVVSIDKTVPMKRMDYGVALVVKTEKETIPVHLGPGWFIERIEKPFAVGDKVEVKGVRGTFLGKPAIMAAEVKRGADVLVLRDANGVPAWAGWGWKR